MYCNKLNKPVQNKKMTNTPKDLSIQFAEDRFEGRIRTFRDENESEGDSSRYKSMGLERFIEINLFLFWNRILSEARDLSTFPNLNGTTALEVLRLDRAGISSVPITLCTTCPRLKSL